MVQYRQCNVGKSQSTINGQDGFELRSMGPHSAACPCAPRGKKWGEGSLHFLLYFPSRRRGVRLCWLLVMFHCLSVWPVSDVYIPGFLSNIQTRRPSSFMFWHVVQSSDLYCCSETHFFVLNVALVEIRPPISDPHNWDKNQRGILELNMLKLTIRNRTVLFPNKAFSDNNIICRPRGRFNCVTRLG